MSEVGVDLEQIRVFMALASTGSISRAAEELNTSRSRVRRLLDELEVSLGVSLVNRARTGMALTEDGENFLPKARATLGSVRALVAEMREKQPEPAGRIRVGLQVGYPNDIAVMVTKTLHRHFRRSKIEHCIHERPAELLPDRADLVICLGEQSASIPVVQLRVATVRQRLVASAAFVERNGPFQTVADVVPHLVGCWRGPGGGGGARIHLADGSEFPIDPTLITPDEGLLQTMARTGLGVVYAPCPRLTNSNGVDLVEVLGSRVGRDISASIMAPELLSSTPRLQLLLRAARTAMRTFGRD